MVPSCHTLPSVAGIEGRPVVSDFDHLLRVLMIRFGPRAVPVQALRLLTLEQIKRYSRSQKRSRIRCRIESIRQGMIQSGHTVV
jgi:hypothetical protein